MLIHIECVRKTTQSNVVFAFFVTHIYLTIDSQELFCLFNAGVIFFKRLGDSEQIPQGLFLAKGIANKAILAKSLPHQLPFLERVGELAISFFIFKPFA